MNEKDLVQNQDLPITVINGENLHLLAIQFDNGFFVTISDKESFNLGTTALSLPSTTSDESQTPKPQIDRKKLITATVIGSRNELYAKALAEKIVVGQGKMVYLSVYFQENNEDLFIEAIKLVDQLLTKITT